MSTKRWGSSIQGKKDTLNQQLVYSAVPSVTKMHGFRNQGESENASPQYYTLRPLPEILLPILAIFSSWNFQLFGDLGSEGQKIFARRYNNDSNELEVEIDTWLWDSSCYGLNVYSRLVEWYILSTEVQLNCCCPMEAEPGGPLRSLSLLWINRKWQP